MAKILNSDSSLLLIVDIQEKLVNALDKDIVVQNADKLANAAKIMGIPIVATQQYTKGLGMTVEAVSQHFYQNTPILEKTSFSALSETGFLDALRLYNRNQIVLCGIETHICVHQTAAALIDAGFDVFIAKDACASRKKYEFKMGIDRMHDNGAVISCLEMIVFEWLKSSAHPNFKEIQALIK